jgi:TonB-linked SusC/RagA family outer membrane protein
MQVYGPCKVPVFAGAEPKLFPLKREIRKILLVMKITAILLLVGLQVSAKGWGQEKISLSLTNAPLEQALNSIADQIQISFLYRPEYVKGKKVTIDITNASLTTVLDLCVGKDELTYEIVNKTVIIHPRTEREKTAGREGIQVNNSVNNRELKGRVLTKEEKPLVSANIINKRTGKGTITDANGNFELPDVNQGDIIVISYTGYSTRSIKVNNFTVTIVMELTTNELDQVIMQAYGTTTRRLKTGNIAKVTSSEITSQPLANPLGALEGRVPGLLLTPSSGVPGSSIGFQLRGQSSIKQGTQPLFIIDGTPLNLNTGVSLSQIQSVVTQSPFFFINPNDIESIEVLKDADATAIYGSQGANGVVLITTKKAKNQKTKIDLDYYRGIGKATRIVDLLNTEEYLQMRQEAFANDNITPTISNAPDLLLWDSTKYTDWEKYFIGGTAQFQNIQASLSGGNSNTQFRLSGNLYQETSVFPHPQPNNKGSIRISVNNISDNKKFTTSFTASYGVNKLKLPLQDLTQYIFFSPNAPDLYDSTGKLNWVSGVTNPMSFTVQKFASETNNLLGSANLRYEIVPGLSIKTDMSYRKTEMTEQSITPISSFRPSTPPQTGSVRIVNSEAKSWTVEPQIDFNKNIKNWKISFLIGSSFQQRNQTRNETNASNYTNDDFLGILSAAPKLTESNNFYQYNYTAVFGRAGMILKNKYIVNLTGRRDGSSKFGPAERFANFGAIGGAWILSEEKIIKKLFPIISFAKINASYGVTGNDQINDYLYLDLWSSSSIYQYQGVTGFLQSRIYNPYLQWERNKKFEIGTDLGFLNDRITATFNYYRNKSDNQLLPYVLPGQTGFTSIPTVNRGAVVLNSGFEATLNTKNINGKNFSWETDFNISIPKNKLLEYPGIENTSDRFILTVGRPLTIKKGFLYNGLDASTGVYQFVDQNNDKAISSPTDYVDIANLAPKYFGGFNNKFKYKDFSLNIFLQFQAQDGLSYASSQSTAPGAFLSTGGNQPKDVLNRWAKSGEESSIEKFTATTSSPTYIAYGNYRSSSGVITDASFIRLKNVALSYYLPNRTLKKMNLQGARVYFQGENLLLITNYKGADPQVQSIKALPPLRILTAGIQLTI